MPSNETQIVRGAQSTELLSLEHGRVEPVPELACEAQHGGFEFRANVWNLFWRSIFELTAGSFEFGAVVLVEIWMRNWSSKQGALSLEGVCGTLFGG